jgi:hypothetical protein
LRSEVLVDEHGRAGAIGGHFPALPSTPKPTGGPTLERHGDDPMRAVSQLRPEELPPYADGVQPKPGRKRKA